jgi:hypothetical protein
LRTYCRAAASISSGVAAGSRPRSVVMFRHTTPQVRACDGARRRPIEDLYVAGL